MVLLIVSWTRYISALTRAEVEFGLIPKDHWVQPPWIDEEKATAAREEMVQQNVIYGGACFHPTTITCHPTYHKL